MAKKIDDFCGVGDVVELGANYFNHHTSANLVADPTHPLHKPNRYKGLPTEYYANGGTLWPLSGPVKSGLFSLLPFLCEDSWLINFATPPQDGKKVILW